MVKTTKAKNSRMYLKILGTVLMAFAVLELILSIVMFFIDVNDLNLAGFGLGETLTELQKTMDDNTIKNVMAGALVGASVIDFLVAWVIRRSGMKEGKTTLALVLVILECISSAYALFAAGFGSIVTAIVNIITLTIYVLALMAIMNVRKETGE